MKENPTVREMVKEIFETAKKKGWWDEGKEKSFGEFIALCHAELSEALEEYREGNPNIYYKDTSTPITKATKPEGLLVELADCIIRIFDFCGKHDLNIVEAILLKMEYNKTREYRHGNKRL